MQDAMVTARMANAKKEAGGRILESLGYSASRAINELYDYLIQNERLPFDNEQWTPFTKDRLEKSLDWVDSIAIIEPSEFSEMTLKKAKRHRLESRKQLLDGDSI